MEGKKIFILEDDANFLGGLVAKLRVENFQVLTDSGTESLEVSFNRLKNFKPDYAVLDLILPKVDGFDFIKKIKTDAETSSLPIFVFTNLGDNDSRSRGLSLGVDYYYLKNELILDELIDKIKKIIINLEKTK